jgi:hypothetical protein
VSHRNYSTAAGSLRGDPGPAAIRSKRRHQLGFAEVNDTRPQILRPKRWLLAMSVAVTLLFIMGAMFTHTQFGWTFTSITFVAMSVLAVGGVLELVTSRIVLSANSLEAGSIWSRRRYAVADIESVTWASGSGVSVKLSNGGWAKMPELDFNAQGLANTLRAWLKRYGRHV